MSYLTLITRIVFVICISCTVHSCSNVATKDLDLFIGTWKVEGKAQYEVWEKISSNAYKGYAYRLNNNEKSITETLSIKVDNNDVIFEATVPDQNEGRTVQFLLNTDNDSCFSFENEDHDFPKKIQYKKINDGQMEVRVLGDNDEGFSYMLYKEISGVQ